MKTVFVIYLMLFILLASSCQKNTQAGASGVSANCISSPASCNSSVYQQNSGYSTYGNTYNPFSYYNNSAYLCNCPYDMIPTYNSSAGLGCVRPYYSNPYYVGFSAYLYIGWSNSYWYQMPALSTYNGSSSTCYNGAVQSCTVSESGSCGIGSFCLENSPGSSLGLCVTNYR